MPKYIDVYGEQRSDKWWDVNEALPECERGSRSFLTAFMGESGFMTVMTFDGKDWWEGTHGFGEDSRKNDLVTHWRELPEGPR